MLLYDLPDTDVNETFVKVLISNCISPYYMLS